VPDATGLELIAHELREANDGSILQTEFRRGRAVLDHEEPRGPISHGAQCTSAALLV